MTTEPDIRRAGPDDRPGILDLGRRVLGWRGATADERFFAWKHERNVFGPSPLWVATEGGRVVAFRAFVRWRFTASDGRSISAVRAVDTATDPSVQGRGLFTRLTLGALDHLREEGTQLVFNTPNDRSLPGYLKMGWARIGRLPVSVLLTSPRALGALARARRHAASLESIDTSVGVDAAAVFADTAAVDDLLATSRPMDRERPARRDRMVTEHSGAYFAWRYGYAPLAYRVLLAGASPADGFAVFRVRDRGGARELVLCDLVVPRGDRTVATELTRHLGRAAGADYVIRIDDHRTPRGRFVRVPSAGPRLVCRPLDATPAPPRAAWALSMGDVELL